MISELWKKQKPLMNIGLIFLVCFLILAIIAPFDSTEILGINRWIKPMKFFISLVIFAWTMAVYFLHLQGFEQKTKRISWAMIAIFTIEMLIIVGQALRGKTSHFNMETPLDGILFSVMGIAIVTNTILVGYVTYLYFKADINLPKTIVWGMRLGLIIFLLGSLEGGYMSAQAGHTVGAIEGGKGLPLINWSTVAGDLRIAHFFGLHAIQTIPLFAYLLEKIKSNYPVSLVFAFAFSYFAFFTFLFIQALNGQPFLSKLF